MSGRLGFTGTRRGMTDAQKARVAEKSAPFAEVHHGDCVGADADMHAIARAAGQRVVVHPPTDPKLQACLTGDVTAPAKPYLDRNRDIVDEADVLIATPAESGPSTGGTWFTIRYAFKLGRPVLIVWPDGTATSVGGKS